MLRLGPLVLVALLAIASRVDAQSESATGLAQPPVRGSTYSPPATRPLPSPSALPPPPLASETEPDLFGSTTQTMDERISVRLDALDGHLSSLGARRSSGVGAGVITLLLGGTFIGLGVYANRNGAEDVAKYFFLIGVANTISAGIGFGLQPNTERAYTHFSAIRADESLSPSERLRRSEAILHSLARRRMASRFAQGSIDLTVTAVSFPFLLGGDGFDKSNAFDWIITVSSLISAVQAISGMVQRTEEERRWRIYRTFASTHGGDEVFAAVRRPRLEFRDFAIGPVPQGAFGRVGFTF